jgi:hypothetical protein
LYLVPTVLLLLGHRVVIYPNDHGPPHVHVLGPGWEMKVRLKEPPELVAVLGKPKTSELTEG